ncbi:unnamed protein product, partial [Clonostachys rhizophaga]
DVSAFRCQQAVPSLAVTKPQACHTNQRREFQKCPDNGILKLGPHLNIPFFYFFSFLPRPPFLSPWELLLSA